MRCISITPHKSHWSGFPRSLGLSISRFLGLPGINIKGTAVATTGSTNYDQFIPKWEYFISHRIENLILNWSLNVPFIPGSPIKGIPFSNRVLVATDTLMMISVPNPYRRILIKRRAYAI